MSINVMEHIKMFYGRKCLDNIRDKLKGVYVDKPTNTEIEKLSLISKLFSNEVRIKILLLLAQASLPVCALVAITGKDQTLISHNLSFLKKMGVVEEKRVKKYKIYSLKKHVLIKILSEALEILNEN
ncbi:MAG: ArsR/SmtB family transcription factor [Candidatus Njordarchaeia archaeon]